MNKRLIAIVGAFSLTFFFGVSKTLAHTSELTFSSYTVGENITITSTPNKNLCDPATFPKQLHHANIQQFENNNGEFILDFSNATISLYKNGEKVEGFLYVADKRGVVWFAQHTADSNTVQTTEFDDEMTIVAQGVTVTKAGTAYLFSHITYTSQWERCYLIDGSGYYNPYYPEYDQNQARVTFINPTPIPTPTPTHIPTPLPIPTATLTPVPTMNPTNTPAPTALPTPTPKPIDKLRSKLSFFGVEVPPAFSFIFKNNQPVATPTPTLTNTPTPLPSVTPRLTPTSSPTPTKIPIPTPSPTPIPTANDIFASLKLKVLSLLKR